MNEGRPGGRSRYLRSLLQEVAEGDEIGGYSFQSRFRWRAYDNEPGSGVFFVGGFQHEVRPELRKRDKHLLFARSAGLLDFEVKDYDGRKEYFGTPISVTPRGHEYLKSSWTQRRLASFSGGFFKYFLLPLAVMVFGALILGILGFN